MKKIKTLFSALYRPKVVLWTGTFIIVIMCLFPPWVDEGRIAGYHFLFSDGNFYQGYQHFFGAHIYFTRLIIQCAIVGLITGALLYTLNSKKAGLFVALRSKENELESKTGKKPSEEQRKKVLNLKRGFKRLTLVLAIVAGITGAAFAAVIVYGKYEPPYTLNELEFWSTLPKGKMVGLCILAGLGGGIAGFSATWLAYLIILLIYKHIKWLILGFREDKPANEQKQ